MVKRCAEAVSVREGGTEAAGARRQDVSRSLSRRGGALRRRGGASALGGSGKRRDRAWRSGAVGDATAAMHVVKRGEGTPGGPRAAGSVGGSPRHGPGVGDGTPLLWGILMASGVGEQHPFVLGVSSHGVWYFGGPLPWPWCEGTGLFCFRVGPLMALV